MKVTATEFESTYHGAQVAGNNMYGEYVLHNIDVFNEIVLNDNVRLHACYQTAQSYEFGDVQCLSPELSLSDFGTDKVLLIIDALYESDFENNTDSLKEAFEEIREEHSFIDSINKLRTLYDELNDNVPDIDEHLPEGHSHDLEDYEVSRENGGLELATYKQKFYNKGASK